MGFRVSGLRFEGFKGTLRVSGFRFILVVQYLGVLKVNLWDFKGNILTQKVKGYLLYN